MTDAPYDLGYASVKPDPRWGFEMIQLHLGWLQIQLQYQPKDQFKRGRQDALHDLLAKLETSA